MELPDPVRQRLSNLSLTMFGDSSRTGPEPSEAAGEWRGRRTTRGCGSRAGGHTGRARVKDGGSGFSQSTVPGEETAALRRTGRARASAAAATTPGDALAEQIGMRSRNAFFPTLVPAAFPA